MRGRVYIVGLALCCLFLLGKNAYVTDDAAASVYTSDNVAYTDVAPDGTIVEYYLDEYGDSYVYDENGERLYTYTAPDGTTIEYYLDENGYPYVYDENGEMFGALIPIERYRVTDPEVIDALNGNGDITILYNQ